jgi:hypothetical protein
VLAHTVELALSLTADPVSIHARLEEHRRLEDLIAPPRRDQVAFVTGPPPENSAVLRTDRFYDPARLRRALRRQRDPESAVLWRLDGPHGLNGVESELVRRQSYQPLGKYWALAPARGLARALTPTRVRPNALTLSSATLMIAAAALVALGPRSIAAYLGTSAALALALLLDTADGHLARLQGTATEFGRWLDAYLDELGDLALHACIAWSAFTRDGHAGWLLLGMLYGMGKYLFMVGTSGVSQETPEARTDDVAGVAVSHLPNLRGDAAHELSRPRSARSAGATTTVPADSAHIVPVASTSWQARLVRLIGHADLRWHLWIALSALGRLDAALVFYAVYFPTRSLAGAIRKGVCRG